MYVVCYSYETVNEVCVGEKQPIAFLCVDIETKTLSPPGRLSKEEIERMVNDAEMYKNEDDKQRDRIQAKNQLESYAFNMKSTVEDEKLKDKISDEDKQTITDKCSEVISWLDSNQVSGGSFSSD